MSSIKNLNEYEFEIVRQCIHASYAGTFFPDWEFETLFGVEREELKQILTAWPNIDESDSRTMLSINNTFNNLLGYPHRKEKEWPKYITVSPHEVARIFSKWRGKGIEGYFDGFM